MDTKEHPTRSPEGSSSLVHVYHAIAPTCWWSWGYEALFNRLELVYEDQVDIQLRLGCVWKDLDTWREKMGGLDHDDWEAWRQDAQERMGIPLAELAPFSWQPDSMEPATLAAAAAFRQGHDRGRRFLRAILRRYHLELQDPTHPVILDAAAREADLDLARFEVDLEAEGPCRSYLESQAVDAPARLTFPNIVVANDQGDHRVLEYAFDPAQVEEAMVALTDEELDPGDPGEIEDYLDHHGPAPTREIARVFALDPQEARTRLQGLAEEGDVAPIPLGGGVHWRSPDAKIPGPRGPGSVPRSEQNGSDHGTKVFSGPIEGGEGR